MELKKKLERRKIIVLLAGIIFLVSTPLMLEGIASGHDGTFHLLRIDGIAEGLRNGVFPVKIAASWIDGYGYPASVYYGDMLLYIPAVLRCVGMTNTMAYGCFVFLINVLTVSLAYVCFEKMTSNQWMALAACIIYAAAPYRLITIYIRSAVGEYCALAFLPVIALAVYRIYTMDMKEKKQRRACALLLAAGMTGMIETHVLSTEMTVLVLGLLCVILWKQTFSLAVLRTYGLAVIETVGLNLFFLIPFLDYYVNVPVEINNYIDGSVIRQIQGKGIRIGEFFMFFRDPFSVGTLHNYPRMLFTPGIVLMTVLCAGLWMIFTKRMQGKMKLYTGMAVGIMFLSTDIFPWDAFAYTTIGNWMAQVQFPWRYLGIADVFLTMLFFEVMKWVEDYKKAWRVPALIAVFAVSILSMSFFAGNYTDDAVLYSYLEEKELNTSWTGGSEYLRKGTDKEALTGTVISKDMDQADIITRKGNFMELYCDVTDYAEKGIVTIPVLNYKGYHITDESDFEYEITDGVNNEITFELPADFCGTIYVTFKEPWYWRMAELISLLTLILIICVKVHQRKYSM